MGMATGQKALLERRRGGGRALEVLFARLGFLNRGEDGGAGDHGDECKNDDETEHEARSFRAHPADRGRNSGIIPLRRTKWEVLFIFFWEERESWDGGRRLGEV